MTASGEANHPKLPPLRDVIARFGLNAKRSLGQHFLLDQNLTLRIARAAGDLSSHNIIEIGPGPGGLTRSLLAEGAQHVFAVERDERCIAALEELSQNYPGQLHVSNGDATKIDITSIAPAPRLIVANLPYNVSTVLWISWLRTVSQFSGFTLMFQKEVAERLVAQPNNKTYGRLSVMTQWLCHGQLLFNVDPRAFTPAPKVESSVVQLTPRTAPLAPADWEAMETVTRQLFGQRRKMLRSTIKSLGLDPAALDIDVGLRPENLTIEEFCGIARTWRKSQNDAA